MLTPGQAVLASAFKAIARVPRSRREWLDANFFHGMFKYEGVLNMKPGGRDYFPQPSHNS